MKKKSTIKLVEIARSFSFKVNLGNFQNADFFCDLARTHNASLVPVMNSGNRNATTIGILQDENNVNVIATLYLALLKK